MMVAHCIKVTIHIPQAGSLKAKRSVVKSLIDRLHARKRLSIAETGSHDLWQKAEIGICFVAKNKSSKDLMAQKVIEELHSAGDFEVLELLQEEVWM